MDGVDLLTSGRFREFYFQNSRHLRLFSLRSSDFCPDSRRDRQNCPKMHRIAEKRRFLRTGSHVRRNLHRLCPNFRTDVLPGKKYF